MPPQPHLSSGQKSRKTIISYLDGRTDLWTYSQTDGQMDGLMDGETDRWKRQTSRPKASNALALLLFIGLDLPLGSRAAALIGDEVL